MTKAEAETLRSPEYKFTAQDFRRIRSLLYEDSGISLSDDRLALVYSRLQKRVRALGLPDFKAYCGLVELDAGERRQMLSALTTNLTRFYRETHHFDHLREQILPRLVAVTQRGAPVRIWSAACSTGAEPYSIAVEVMNAIPDAGARNLRILATDIDPKVLDIARQGSWNAEQLEGLPEAARRTWFEPAGPGEWRARDELRSAMRFRELNLTGPWPMRGLFHAIFCRNVAIYFDEPTQETLWSRLAAQLHPGGVLYIGHSERIAGPAANLLDNVGLTTYRRNAVPAGGAA